MLQPMSPREKFNEYLGDIQPEVAETTYQNHMYRLERNETHFCSTECYGKYRSSQALPSFILESGKGYPRWYFAENDDAHNVAVHQLLVIAAGADSAKVFNSRHNVHHRNGCSIDNRPDNLEVIIVQEHGARDGGQHVKQYTWGRPSQSG